MKHLLISVLLGLGVVSAASDAFCQARLLKPSRLPTGVGTVVEVSYLKPFVGGNSAAVFERSGDFGGAETLYFGLGYDGTRYGGTFAFEFGNPDLGETKANYLSLAVLGHWRPQALRSGPWEPIVTGGYVRHALGGVDVASDRLPGFVFNSDTYGDPHLAENVGLLGNGIRLGVGVGRRVFGRGALMIEASGDGIVYGSFSSDGSEDSVPRPGVSFLPRIGVGLWLWPFSRGD